MADNNTISGHFTLTAEQRQFKQMLSAYPQLLTYCDFDQRECDLEGLKAAMGVLSSGERIMGKFFAAVWLGDNALSFDLIDAVKTLDTPEMEVIQNWLKDPVFP